MPKTAVPFTVEDLRTPERLERVLHLFNTALESRAAAASTPLDLGALANSLAPMLRDQLQSPGAFPLNLTALLPAIAGAVVTEGTHNDRLTLFTPPTAVGAIFWETDRTVAYVAINNGGPLVWQFMAGEYVSTFSNRPGDLAVLDRGFLFYAFDQSSVYIWIGATWNTITRRILFNAGFFSIFNAVLTADRTYQLPDADGDLTYDTAPLTLDNILTGGGGALVKDSGVAIGALNLGAWTPWVPVYSTNVGNAAVSFTATPTTALARYKVIGKTGFIEISFTATLNAISPFAVLATLPIAPAFDVISTAWVFNGTVNLAGFIQASPGGATLSFYNSALANWPVSSAIDCRASMVFEVL